MVSGSDPQKISSLILRSLSHNLLIEEHLSDFLSKSNLLPYIGLHVIMYVSVSNSKEGTTSLGTFVCQLVHQ